MPNYFRAPTNEEIRANAAKRRREVIAAYDAAQTGADAECREAYPNEEVDVREARAHNMAIERVACWLGVDEAYVRRVIEVEGA